MNLDELRTQCGDGSPEAILSAVKRVSPKCSSYEDAARWLRALVQSLLDQDRYIAAASLLWGNEIFDARPASVRRILGVIQGNAKAIILGAGSVGKSYTIIAWVLLDWIRDPSNTDFKIISTTAGHAKANIFSSLHRLHEQALFQLPGIRQDGFIGMDRQNRHGAIIQVAIPPGDTGRGVIQGFHPLPRKTPHPRFGAMTRVRAVIDEAIEVPIGLWTGIDNLLVSQHGIDSVKAIAACNPTKVESTLGGKAEPVTGWGKLQLDTDKEWVSRDGWKTVRIDGADNENVIQKRLIYPGFITFEGFEGLRLSQGGENNHLVFGRGMFPLKGSVNTMIPPMLMDNARGSLVFQGQGKVVASAAVDLAFEGDDAVILAAGRYGRALGWRPEGGEVVTFVEPRYCLQVDQLYELPKLLTQAQYLQIRQYCEELNVHPAWLTLDRTGNGTGVHDNARELWSPEVRGITWGSGATETRILDEDSDKCDEVYDGIHTEMYGALRKWLEFDYIKFAPYIDFNKIFKEITQRRFVMTGKGKTNKARIRLEPKKEFKVRLGWSPDHADALVMLLHGTRLNGPEKASMMLERKKAKAAGSNLGITDKVRFHNFADDV